jgi:hypothetical protein
MRSLLPCVRDLPPHCAFVSLAAGSELMAKQRIHKNKDFGGGQYARTEQELYKKAVMLLDKCKTEPRR